MSTRSLSGLEIYLLGTPQVKCDGLDGAWHMPVKAQALLYYLAATGQTHTRAALAHLLWSEHGEEEARGNLRKVIRELRRHFGPYLAIDYHRACFLSAQSCWVDAVEFAMAVSMPPRANCDQLQAALDLYRADFLDGFHVRDAPAFETWMLGERARLRELMIQHLSILAAHRAAEGNLLEAIACMRRLLALEPWREEAHRQLMTWLAQSDQRNAALMQYELCCRALAEELGVEPGKATRELHSWLLQPEISSPPVHPQLIAIEYALVGRQPEWQSLQREWVKAMQSGAKMVWIAGEAGIGKTRLAEELYVDVQRQGHATARARAFALEGRLAYAPLAEWLRSPPLQEALARLDRVWLREVTRLLPELLIQHPDLPVPEPLVERWQQKRLFEALSHAFTHDARPLLLLLDDLQWCDAETLAWVQYQVESAPKTPVLIVGTVRSDEVPEEHPLRQLQRALLHAGRLSIVELTPLSSDETAALGAQVKERALGSRMAIQLYQLTAGNPLFVVEFVRAGGDIMRSSVAGGRDIGRSQVPMLATVLPSKVQAVIEARLARLSRTTRVLAQIAATIGRAFTLTLLMEASQENEETVVYSLDELWQRRIVAEQGDGRYDFTHDRIRDVAYAASSPVKRAFFHRRVAQALEKLHLADLDSLAGELATHYQHAGAWEEALAYYRRAAYVASGLYAHREEVGYLEKAISAAQMLPANGAIVTALIELWLELGTVRTRIHDWGDESVATAWQNAGDLAAQAGNVPHRCQALGYLALIAGWRGQWSQAHALGELILALAGETGDLRLYDDFLARHGITLYHCGEFAQALAAFKRHPDFSAVPVQLAHAWLAEKLPSRVFLSAGQSLWLLGFPDQALAYCRAHFTVRHQQAHVDHHCAAMRFAGILYSFLRDAAAVRQLGEDLVAFCAEIESTTFTMGGQMLRGWAIAQQGDVEQGLPLVRWGVDEEFQRGVRGFEPHSRALLAETLALAGELEEALDEVTAALTFAEECGNCYWNAHLYKLQGDFLHALSFSPREVEACYQRAIDTARRQGAKSLELRAATSLARLWQGQGNRVEAREALLEIYSWFTEGFDTLDLLEAKALLDDL